MGAPGLPGSDHPTCPGWVRERDHGRSPDLSRLAVDLLACCFACGVLMLSVRQGSRFVGFQTRPSENVTLFTDTNTVPRDPPGIAYDTVYSPTGRNEAFGS